jgi:hypothetical protein
MFVLCGVSTEKKAKRKTIKTKASADEVQNTKEYKKIPV